MLIDVDGKRAYAYTAGKRFDARLPVVVFIHGGEHDHSVWILQSRYLAHHGHAVLAVDLPGHGRSEGPALASVEAMADWTLALLAAVGPKQASIVGHSMGSLIALEAAARSVARNANAASDATPTMPTIARIALLATAYPMQVSDALLTATRDDEPRAIEMISIWSSDTAHGGYSHKPSAPAPGFGLVWGGRRLMQRQAKGVLHTDFAACNAYRNGEAAARVVRCPALFILGANDSMTAARSGEAFAATMSDARVVVLPDSGHLVMAEAPDATLSALKNFLA
ncbi:MAG: alpha/beta fold hydrolase [Burkholderiaceae bacterium]